MQQAHAHRRLIFGSLRVYGQPARSRWQGYLKVSAIGLLFDLVYVFTGIQLSHYVLEHQTWIGPPKAMTLCAAVWWAWNYTVWEANWINLNHPAGRVLMLFLMGCALLMVVAIH